MTQETKKGKHTFDLSDGFGKEDVFAVFAGIWNFIKSILKIILWPYVWISRVLGRSIRFIRTKEASEKALNEDERIFMESIPTFFILIGLFSGVLLSVLVWLGGTDIFDKILRSITGLEGALKTIYDFFAILIEIILTVIGLGYRDDGTERKTGIVDIIRTILDIVWEIVKVNPLFLFLGIGIVGVVIAVILIILSETGVVSAVINIILKILNLIITAPSKIFSKLNGIYLGFNRTMSSIVIGRERLKNRSLSFHRKNLLLSYALGIYTFLSGLFVLASQPELLSDATSAVIFIIIVLLAVGVGVGFLEMLIIVRFLDKVSRGKYNVETATN